MQPFNMHLAGEIGFFITLHMAQKLRTALLQVDLFWEDIQRNIELFEKKIKELPQEVDLIILPEMFSTGFSMNAKNLAEPVKGQTFEWMRKTAAERNAAVTGSIIVAENGSFYNRLYFVYPDGTFKKYDKRHTFTLARENETYASGKQRLIVEYKGWRICPLVCYDLRFPVWARNTEDYDLLIYVANWPAARVAAWDTLLKARAIENMSYCIGVNRVGKDGNNLEYVGHSAAYDCLGKMISEAHDPVEFTEVVELDKQYLKDTRSQLKFLQDRDKFTVQID
ncbi:Predicted amidohydrolase [Salinimicrobium sediminis]|uniref:Omega-amidase YafV n=2 Tax=Salinimicrobium sediminis TaxID=1343891 RepID=A0A285X198_9FLAO|nr:Predicted amidohydrolase [Salinimicrobium sediminis]